MGEMNVSIINRPVLVLLGWIFFIIIIWGGEEGIDLFAIQLSNIFLIRMLVHFRTGHSFEEI